MTTLVCDLDCFNCKFKDCINENEVLTPQERKQANLIDQQVNSVDRYIPHEYRLRYHSDTYIENYKKSQKRYFSKKYYYANIEKFRKVSRDYYHSNKKKVREKQKTYYDSHKEEILNQKKSYYLENKEHILEKIKSKYVPHPVQVIDTPQAQTKREREKARYLANKEEINRKRREKRKESKNGIKSCNE